VLLTKSLTKATLKEYIQKKDKEDQRLCL